MTGRRKAGKQQGGHPSGLYWLAFNALLLFVLTSGLGVVYASHVSRQRLNVLQQLEQDRNDLQVEWGKLLLEQSSLVAQGKVESVAVSELGMQMPSMNEVVVFTGD